MAFTSSDLLTTLSYLYIQFLCNTDCRSSWQEFEYLAELLRWSGYSQNDLETAVAAATPVTWSMDRRKEFTDRLSGYCKPSSQAAAFQSTNSRSGFGFFSELLVYLPCFDPVQTAGETWTPVAVYKNKFFQLSFAIVSTYFSLRGGYGINVDRCDLFCCL